MIKELLYLILGFILGHWAGDKIIGWILGIF